MELQPTEGRHRETRRQGGFTTTSPVAKSEAIGPIELKMKKTISRLKGCKYPDTFDWSVYDKIASKFDAPPRGGVVFNTTFKLVNQHSSCSKCHYAFELDTYGRGCFHNCEYCYAKDQLTSHGYWNNPQPFPVDLSEIRKVFYTVFETSRNSKWRSIMEQRIPLRIGSMSDSFMLIDRQYKVTKELLKILKFYRYPYVVFTRSPLVSDDAYLSLMDPDISSVQFSITGNNEKLLRKMEPRAPSYKSRLRALEILQKSGIRTAARVNPLFPRYPDGFYTDPDLIQKKFGSRKFVPALDLYDENFVGQLADTGTPTLLVGFARLTLTSMKRLSNAIGKDLSIFFRKELFSKSGFSESRYSEKEIQYYYGMFHREANLHNLRFSTCYIGNGIRDYFQYQHLWSNKSDCCDIAGYVSGFSKSSQDIPWSTRTKHAGCKSSCEKNRLHELKFEKRWHVNNATDMTSQSPITP